MSTDQVKYPTTASGQCLQINEKKTTHSRVTMSTHQVKNSQTHPQQVDKIFRSMKKKLPIAGDNVYTSGKKSTNPPTAGLGVGRGRNNVDRSCQGKVIMCTHKMVQRVVKVWSYRV